MCVYLCTQSATAVLGERDSESSVHLWHPQIRLCGLLSGGHCGGFHGQLFTVRTSSGQGTLLSTDSTCHNSVTCYPTQVNTPRLNPSHAGHYSIHLPRMDGRLSWPRWLVTYRDSLPVSRRSPIQVLTWQCAAGSGTRNLLITRPMP